MSIISIVEEDQLVICSKTANLSNNHIGSKKEKNQSQNINLKSLREKNLDRPIFVQININSIRNKFQFLASKVISNLDVLLVSEAKLDDSFPTAQFLLDGFSKPCRLDRCSNGGGLLLYIKGDISSRLLTDLRLSDNVECLSTKINIRNKKWLLCCSYNPQRNNISNHISHLSKGLDNYISHCDNILFLGDFNSQPLENCVNDFCNVYNLSNLVKEPTCYKNRGNPSCIDLFLTNRPKYFQSTMTMETAISDFHKMIITVLKFFYKKQKPKIIHYRNYKTFNANLFKEELNNELLNTDINNAELVEFTSTVLSVLDKHAPIKRKYIRANNSMLMTKELRAAIMQRSKLRQKFLKERSNDSKHLYNRQRNLCVSLLRKTKRDYFK